MGATVAVKNMKPETRSALVAAVKFHRDAPYTGGNVWFKPKAIGGNARNRWASHFKSLIKRGYIERRDASAPGAMRDNTNWEYRVTEAGVAAIAPEHAGGWYGARCHGQ